MQIDSAGNFTSILCLAYSFLFLLYLYTIKITLKENVKLSKKTCFFSTGMVKQHAYIYITLYRSLHLAEVSVALLDVYDRSKF